MQYRPAKEKGGTYFFPVNLEDRKSNFLVEHIEDLRYVVKNQGQRAKLTNIRICCSLTRFSNMAM
jgi:hypothetical protein